MSVIEHPIRLPKLAFLTAWDMLDLDTPHPVLGVDRHYWMSDQAQREVHTRTLALLAEHGLARRDRLNPMWRDTLALLNRPGREYYAWTGDADDNQTATLIAVGDRHAVRMLVDHDSVTVEPVAVTGPATSLMRTLPDMDGAAVRDIHVPKAFHDNPHTPPDDPLAERADTRDLDYLNQLLGEPRDAAHQLYTALRGSDGCRRRSSPITALDLTGRGRILTYLTADNHIALTSGTPHNIVKALADTHTGLGQE